MTINASLIVFEVFGKKISCVPLHLSDEFASLKYKTGKIVQVNTMLEFASNLDDSLCLTYTNKLSVLDKHYADEIFGLLVLG